MVMPINKNTPNENDDLKRKRSISPEDGNKNEGDEISNKKFRPQNHGTNNGGEEEDDNDESNYSQVVDIIGDGGTGDDDSCISDNSNSTDNNSGKFLILKKDSFDRIREVSVKFRDEIPLFIFYINRW